LVPRLRRSAETRGSALARLLAGGISALLTLLAASAWMLAPRTPAGTLFSRWAHVAPSPDALDGQVQAVTLDGLPMPPSGVSLDPAGMLAAALAAGLGVLPAAAGFPPVH